MIKREQQQIEECDAFVMFVMSHGGTGTVSPHSGDKMDVMDDILKRFDSKSAPHLQNKPKMFFFDTCRGGKHALQYYTAWAISLYVGNVAVILW